MTTLLPATVCELGQREQSVAVHAWSSACARCDAERRAAPLRCPGPGANAIKRSGHAAGIADAVLDRVGADEDRVVVTRRAALKRVVERAAIARRQNHDRGKDQRLAAERRNLARERGGLPRRPRDHDARAGQRPARSRSSCARRTRPRIAAAPRASNSCAERLARARRAVAASVQRLVALAAQHVCCRRGSRSARAATARRRARIA